jgi:GNAT superfamily N-acetyltransferase
MNYDFHTDDFFVSTDRKLLDYHFITTMLLGSYWGGWLTHEIIAESVRNSLCFGLYQHGEPPLSIERQIGFARVISDQATFSYIADVIVHPDFRGRGLGKFLISSILKRPELKQGVTLLRTRTEKDFYKKFGFEDVPAMRRIPPATS